MNSITVGITGPSGAGKTTVTDFFKNHGFKVIDADLIAKKNLKNKACIKELSKAFGNNILSSECEIVPNKLASIAFSSHNAVLTLNKITHPFIIDEIKKELESYKKDGKKVILDVPLLFETKLNLLCDVTLCVIADKKLRLKRILSRDNIDLESALRRFSIQPEDDFYEKQADIILENNRDEKYLNATLCEIISKLTEPYNGKKIFKNNI